MSVSKGIRITRQFFATSAILYLIIPVVIFFFGFLKIYFAVPFAALTIFSSYLFIKDFNKSSDKKLLDNDGVTISYPLFIISAVVIILICLIAGIGEFSWSTIDHRVRWVILKDLIDYKWPVIYDFKTQANPLVSEVLGDGKAAFAYYFTIWMIPALIGKVMGLMAARVALVLWSSFGMMLIFMGICLWDKRAIWPTLVVFLLFGGLDTIPYHTELMMGIEKTWEGWNDQMYIHGSYSQLMNVFHQCIPGWLVTMILMLQRNNRSVGFVGSLMFCYSPWATIGLFPIALCQLIRKSVMTSDKKTNLTNILGYNNLVVPVIVLLVFAPFFTANPDATSVRGFIWNFIDGGPMTIIIDYILYVVIEFGIWALIVRKNYRQEPLLLLLVIELMIFPVYNISNLNDLLMRGSMAPMFILMLMVITTVNKTFDEIKNTKRSELTLKPILVMLVLVLSMMTQIDLLTASINFTITELEENQKQMMEQIGSFGNINDESETDMVDLQFFVEDYEETFFFKYLAK